MDTTTLAQPLRCPACGFLIEAVTSGQPLTDAGGIGICTSCSVYLSFTEHTIRVLTNAEWAALPATSREFLTRLREGLRTTVSRGTSPSSQKGSQTS